MKKKFKTGEIVIFSGGEFVDNNFITNVTKEMMIVEYQNDEIVTVADKDGAEFEIKESTLAKREGQSGNLFR